MVNGNGRQWEMLAYSTMAANFLQVEDMVQLCCAAFAEILKGKLCTFTYLTFIGKAWFCVFMYSFGHEMQSVLVD